MPAYARPPFKRVIGDTSLYLFQLKYSRTPTIYYRLKLGEHPRVEGRLKATVDSVIEMREVQRHTVWPEIDAEITRLIIGQQDRAAEGLPIGPTIYTVADVVERWLDTIEMDVEHDHATKSALINREGFVKHYVRKYEPWQTMDIAKVRDADIEEWAKWRDAYWINGPGSELDKTEFKRGQDRRGVLALWKRMNGKYPLRSTVAKHVTFWTDIFEFAVAEKLILRASIPLLKPRKRSRGSNNRRVGIETQVIDAEMWAKLAEAAPKWIELGAPIQRYHEKGYLLRTYPDNRPARRIVWAMMIVMRAYGLRTAEAMALKWSMVETKDVFGRQEKVVTAPHVGGERKGHRREIEAIPAFADLANDMLSRELPEAIGALHYKDGVYVPGKSTPVFPITAADAGKWFHSLVAFAGVEQDASGASLKLGSLRHSALSDMLLSDVPPAVVAKWGGTSIQMLDAHYSKLMVRRDASAIWARLRKEAA